MSFVHLRTHTEFSVVDGTLRIDEVLAAAAQDQQVALAITDLANLFGAIKFYSAARKAGIKPILGADVWMQAEGDDKQPSRLLLLVQSHRGYLNLCELLSRAWLSNVQRAQACLKWEWLEELGAGLICLSGAQYGVIGLALLSQDQARAKAYAQRLAGLFPQRFYIELQRAGLAGQEALVRASVPLAAALGLPVAATHPVQFLSEADFEAHEARTCIAQGETLANPRRARHFSPNQHFQTQSQMQALFADIPSALANTEQIARRCSLQLTLGKPALPDFPTPEVAGRRMSPDDYFRHISHEGLEQRLLKLFPLEAEREQQRPTYVARLEFEIATILKMGFPGYFLIVADFIDWARSNGCPVGPGRGSGAGSLVAYALKITDLDPLRYNLLFERFLNPDRVSMPDFDIDFCQANRERVIDYVKDKYGRAAVSQIATFGTMAAKAALRDVGRVLGMGYGQVDSIAKLVPAPPGKSVTLARVPDKPDPGVIYARLEAPEIEEREKREEEVAELLSLAERVEGMVRNIGMHAGGVLIAPGRITDFCPLYMQPGSNSAVSQFDKDDVEAIGLVKFDFLGLATLTILELAKDFIIQRHPEQKDFDFASIALTDKATYKLLSDGRTVAVFQLESRGMQGMLRDAKPSLFEDIIALVALYRPGPMDLIPSFCARKHGKEAVSYPHPLMAEVLKETYGIMVYQEQVMQVAQRVGGYSLGSADLLRRAMGKKKVEEMAEHRASFAEGAAGNGIAAPLANEIFDLMEKFAGYGFNKSHAAAYALLAYHTAWLKVHYPSEFAAANMSVAMDDTDKLKIFYDDALAQGLRFEAPDINTGEHRFVPVDDHTVRYGLGAIKGTGQGAIEAIVKTRSQGGRFASFYDFCARIDRRCVNKRVVEALIKAGAFDLIEIDRARLLASVARGYTHAETLEANADQGGLFDFGPDDKDGHAASTKEPDLVEADSWSIKQRLSLEKTAIGFYLSGHLFDQNEEEVRRIAKRRIADVTDSREPVLLAGIVSDLRVINGNRGRMCLFKLDDKTDVIESVVSEDLLNAHRDCVADDELIIVQGKVQNDRFSGGLRLTVQQVWDLAGARARFGRHFAMTVNGEVAPLAEVIKAWPARQVQTEQGPLTLGLSLRLAVHRESVTAELDLGEDALFWPSDEALARLTASAHGRQAGIVYESGERA